MLNKTQIRYCLDTMADMYPEAHCELIHENPFELVIAVALSAQCTDALVNKVTKNLFQKYKTPEDYLSVSLEELQQDIRSIGLYRNKAKNIQKLCQMLLDDYNGKVPEDRDELTKLAICRWKDSVLEVEKTLMKKVPMDEWGVTHHRMIFFGRYHCKAQRPQCEECRLLEVCREGKKRMKVK
jgi:endonuclease III